MAKKVRKYYVVWAGHETGVFDSWAACSRQVAGYPGARYMSFLNRAAAERAFEGDSSDFIGKKRVPALSEVAKKAAGKPILKSICVDAACDGAPGRLEYRAVETSSGRVFFEKGPFEQGTNNVGEFLALVNAAALLRKTGSRLPIYTDSRTALSWFRKKKANTKLRRTARNAELFELIERAEKWLADNPVENRILKWNTAGWGEIPADYGRK